MRPAERGEEPEETTTLAQPPIAPASATAPVVAQTAIATLSRSDSSRSRTTAGLGALLAGFAAVFSLLIPGDRTGRIIMMSGLSMVALTNGWVYFVVREPTKLRTWLVVVWTSSAIGTLSLLPFCGVLSGGLIAPMLVVSLASLGQSRGGSIATCITVVVGHATLMVFVASGVLPDRGRMPMPELSSLELVLVEVGIAGVVVVAFAIGLWSRRNTMQAFAELERRARAEGQQEVLGEVRDLVRAIGVNRLGRYSDQRLGRFHVGAVLGRGAMGEVYEATADNGGPPVALKVLHEEASADPQRLARFEREARAILAIDSRHVVSLLEVGAEPVPYLAMERLYGDDLAALLRERRTLAADVLLAMVDDVARGLEAARRAGVIHRDIKPSNLFQDRTSGLWKVLDFGVSRLAGGGGTLTGDRVVGTPGYMAPEQVTGEPITHATDVYGLAAVVYRCLTGRPPHAAENINELLYRVAHTRPRRPSSLANVSAAVDSVLGVGLARRASDRHASTTAFAEALRAALHGDQDATIEADWA
jgi:serine/threonine-protein kinase